MSEVMRTEGSVLDARYRLVEKLGAGGQGEVWRAYDASRGCEVALKILNPALAQDPHAWASLKHEHTLSRRLDHPFILEIFPPERVEGLAVLPMELAAGGDLCKLRGKGYLEVVPPLIEVAVALEHAHDRGVIHRDLKPGNVLFDARGRIKLADFGIAEMRSGPRGSDGRGSPFSASPEQLRGEAPQVSDDIYGLGALLYELLSGYPPHYPHFDPLKIRSEPAPALVPVSPIPPVLASLVSRMLDKDPTHRPVSMREVIEDLDAALMDTLAFDEVLPVEDEPEVTPLLPAKAKTSPRMPLTSISQSTQELPNATWHPRLGARPAREILSTSAPSVITAAVNRSIASARARPVSPAAPPGTAPEPPPPLVSVPPAPVSAGAPVAKAPRPPAEPLTPEDALDIPEEERPSLSPLQLAIRGRWFILLAAGLAAAALLLLFWPEHPRSDAEGSRPASTGGVSGAAADPLFQIRREDVNRRLAALEVRGAAQWGGADYAAARTLAVEAEGLHDAGNLSMALDRLTRAAKLLTQVEDKAASVLATQLAAGEKALAAGQQELALQSFDLARRIAPNDPRIPGDERRAQSLSSVLPLLASARNGENTRNYSRASQEYRKVLTLDPGNTLALEGLSRVSAAADDEHFSKAIGRGFTALAAGRLKEARQAFEKARALRPNAVEPTEGLKRVAAAAAAKDLTSARSRAAAFEAQGRWEEAERIYDHALQQDGSLVFAREGKARAAEAALLGRTLQGLINNPEQLLVPATHQQAIVLLQQARGQPGAMHTQVLRLQGLLDSLDTPVHLGLLSDGETEIAISGTRMNGLGILGSFGKRDLELKPGRYTLKGSRRGYRDVRRDITLAPGEENVTITVSCTELLSST